MKSRLERSENVQNNWITIYVGMRPTSERRSLGRVQARGPDSSERHVPEQFSTLAFLPLFEGQKVTFVPLSSGKNINESRLSRELGK